MNLGDGMPNVIYFAETVVLHTRAELFAAKERVLPGLRAVDHSLQSASFCLLSGWKVLPAVALAVVAVPPLRPFQLRLRPSQEQPRTVTPSSLSADG